MRDRKKSLQLVGLLFRRCGGVFWESDVNYNHATKRNESLVTVAVSLRHLVVSPLASLEVYVIIIYIAAGLETIGLSCVVHGVVVVVVVCVRV